MHLSTCFQALHSNQPSRDGAVGASIQKIMIRYLVLGVGVVVGRMHPPPPPRRRRQQQQQSRRRRTRVLFLNSTISTSTKARNNYG